MAALGTPFVADNAAHEDEHSLEVQMPFVARACPDSRVVLVASSDLPHYPPVVVAREIDRRVLQPILRLDGADLLRVEEEIRSSGDLAA